MNTSRTIFFLLLAKCPVIAAYIGCDVGEAVVYHWLSTVGAKVVERM